MTLLQCNLNVLAGSTMAALQATAAEVWQVVSTALAGSTDTMLLVSHQATLF